MAKPGDAVIVSGDIGRHDALFSCQRAAAKACCFHVKAGAEQERGGTLNHAPPKTAYSSSSKSISSISKPKIILISASLIRPFNSISTTI